MKAIHLRTEYLENPLGMDMTAPRFYWNCEGGIRQTAYQILCKCGEEVLWDSGKTASASMTHIPYGGRPLYSRERVDWCVRLWDENGAPGECSAAWFEMGLLDSSDWQADWITGNYAPEKNRRYPADCFRKHFPVRQSVFRARLYITACGLYEAMLNGHRIGEFQLAPGSTDYRKRLQYQTYDVTDLLSCENTLEITLADGWYRGSIGCFGPTHVFGRQTKLLCQLEIVYADGTQETVISDNSWDWCNDGPIRFADLKDGEIVQAGMVPTYSGKAALAEKSVLPTASNNVPVTCHEEFPAKLIVTPTGKRVLDFGQNLAGFVKFKIRGAKGQRVRLLLGEMLDEHGEFTQHNIHKHHKPVTEFGQTAGMLLMFGMENRLKAELQPTPRQEILFYCSGEEDHYQTRFAVFGFRYALIETEATIDPAAFHAVAVYSNLEPAGRFTCSSEKVNQLFSNTLWSMKSNFLDVPTDCPQRERLAWTGDAQVFFHTAAYLMNVAPFFRKWMRDVKDNQFQSGKISAVVPYNGMSMVYDNTGESVGWGDAAVLVPYRYWKRYGDRRMLTDFYDVMRRYAMFMIRNTGCKDKKAAKANPWHKYVYEKGHHLGEWLEPREFQDTANGSGAKLTRQTEIATAYLHYTMSCMAEIAGDLGKAEDEALFREYADGAKEAYQYLYLRNGAPDTDRQAKLVRPLEFNLAEGKTKTGIERRLAQAVTARDYKIGTGFLSTPFVLGVLTRAGYPELAYRMLENEACPGWLYPITRGATTIWEDWEGSEFASRNHYSYGAVCQWLFDTVAGIQMDGENHFRIAPIPGGTLTHAKASYRSLYGEVASGWEKTEEGLSFHLTIPANCTAEFCLPGGAIHVLSAGDYTFSEKEVCV
ncbi:MAG: family 78 glycoside hydrolase catalytic domain [Faecousia sp.]